MKMDKLNILIATPAFNRSAPQASQECIQQIQGVSPTFTVKDVSALIAAELEGDKKAKEKLDKLLIDVDVIFGLILPPDLLSRAPRLKWVQTMSAGVDRLASHEIWRSPVMITGVSGIHATPIGEFVLGFMLMFVKGAPVFFQMKQKREWARYMPTVLRGKTVGIIGLGAIGREIARLSKAFGMRVLATRRSAKKTGRARYVDTLYPPGQLKQLIAESDFVVVATPLTLETRGLIGEEELRSMKATAYIINIGRGSIIDEEALIKALDGKWIAGAGLDVTATEPLPPDSRLWDFDNVILSPHISGGMQDYIKKATGLFCENLRHYLNGEKLRNVIDKEKGY